MLDTTTKRRIDTARDILVGKVPDPKSQVEQITIALIYKFMDDMDAEAEELGGKRKFFTGDFARYGWARLMAPSLGGHEMLGLYGEGISKIPENPGIPPLFREIFKNAYLPYRDPETLKAFLKIIDEFSYDHSERLGDAFEYLLSVLGSQGDAGQFRTPRHIIDFMVEVIAPRKGESILDPACGTAGFLISAYKYILRANTVAQGHSRLTPDDRGRLAKNFQGYDISPDMVRLSLVNLYLHGFTDPHIFEYDTLTSEERWNEFADVILANPPFMSPKGGIKPHKRFSIQAKRSEVLFVDYMAEHLTPTGRAGIIVPEGIIFQSQTAYKELRRLLVENSLVAVVSLPAGCFNPYSGVKTSILILDKGLARQSETIGFFKVENDGFGLGAQRRAIEKNDLPQVQAELETYLNGLCGGAFSAKGTLDFSAKGATSSQPGATPQENVPKNMKGLKARPNRSIADGSGLQPSDDDANLESGALPQAGMDCAVGEQFTTGLIVPKEKIAANGDYNLSGERYREGAVSNTAYALVPVGRFMKEGVKTVDPRNSPDEMFELWSIPAFDVGSPELLRGAEVGSQKKVVAPGDVLLSRIIPHIRRGWVVRENSDGRRQIASTEWIVFSSEEVLPGFLRLLLVSDFFHVAFMQTITGVGGSLSRANPAAVGEIEIPLPPLEVQKEIVAEIEGYQKVINGARAVLDHYRPLIPIHPDWPIVDLGEVIESKPKNGYSGSPVDYVTELKVLSLSATTFGTMDLSKFKYLDEAIPLDSPCRCRRGDIYLQRGNTKELVGTAAIFDTDDQNYIYPDLMIRVRADQTKIRSHYLLTVLQSGPVREFVTRNAVGAAGSMPKINQGIVESIPIPLPPLATQQAIVAEIAAEQALVAANRELITRFERKIQATLSRIWGEETSERCALPAGS
ncbi:MAG: N-6 DNA methylase [Chthoniobacteraceae bacterium]